MIPLCDALVLQIHKIFSFLGKKMRAKVSFAFSLSPKKFCGYFCCRYSIGQRLSEKDKTTVIRALYFHPRRNEKLGIEPPDIEVCG